MTYWYQKQKRNKKWKHGGPVLSGKYDKPERPSKSKDGKMPMEGEQEAQGPHRSPESYWLIFHI
jgi:hypothetical protein